VILGVAGLDMKRLSERLCGVGAIIRIRHRKANRRVDPRSGQRQSEETRHPLSQ
jgi:hypothetical protein